MDDSPEIEVTHEEAPAKGSGGRRKLLIGAASILVLGVWQHGNWAFWTARVEAPQGQRAAAAAPAWRPHRLALRASTMCLKKIAWLRS